MSSRQLPEVPVDMIKDYIKANIDAKLAALRTDRNDAKIDTPTFNAYYVQSISEPLRAPCLFVIADSISFQKEQKGANYVNARIDLSITGVVEDRNTQVLTRRIYRYLAAVNEIIENAELLSSNNKIKIVCIPERCDFSNVYTKEDETGAFRQEFTITCTLNCYENF